MFNKHLGILEATVVSIEIPQTVAERALSYTGPGRQLEAALGALVVGQLYGRRALLMLHGSRIIRRHERILGVSFKDACPHETSETSRLYGIRLADKLGGFWKVAHGEAAGRERFEFLDDDQGRLL